MLEVIHGNHPIAIATSLAFEGLSGNHPDSPSGINNTQKYKQI